jgi:hypothetical protein
MKEAKNIDAGLNLRPEGDHLAPGRRTTPDCG